MKKFMSVLTVCALVCSLAMNSFAADVSEDYYVTAHVMSAEETFEMFSAKAMTKTGTVLLQQNTTGNQGIACAMFTADEESVSFRFTSAPTAKTYNIILHEGNQYNQGTQVVVPSEDVPINNGTSFYDLTIGNTYYFVVNSDDVSSAVTARYEVKTF